MLDCHLELLPSAPNPIVGRKRVRFHVGTAELMGYAVLLGQDRLEPGQSGFVQIRIEEPSFALPGDRFIVRQYSPMVTIGGGQILDTYPPRHRRSEKGVVENLRILRDGTVEERLMFLIEDSGLARLCLGTEVQTDFLRAPCIAPTQYPADLEASKVTRVPRPMDQEKI